jgi:UDP-glucose 4-epimerase
VIYSVKDPIHTNQANVEGTLNLLKNSSDFGVKRFIFASSAAIYGDTNSPIKKEDVSPNPRSPYGVSKLAAENYARVFYKTYDLETVCLRYFNVYGPRQNFDIQGAYGGAITIFTNRLLRNMPPIIYGDVKQTRDFIYIKDVVEANMLALKTQDAAGEVFNVGTGINISLNRVADILKEKLNKQKLITIHTDPRPADVRHGYADISKIKRILGFNPKISPEEGLANLVNCYKKIVDP